jgi:tetratricopeptide (TPR) repeat protein
MDKTQDGKVITDPAILQLANEALQYCINEFGPPKDPNDGYRLVWSRRSACNRVFFSKHYTIEIQTSYNDRDALACILAHEMYHRVTLFRGELRWTRWVDEMLAHRTSHHFLDEYGSASYAKAMTDRNRRTAKAVTTEEIARLEWRLCLAGIVPWLLPQWFSPTIECWAAALESIVGWDQFKRLVSCDTWKAWLDALPDSDRKLAEFLLNLKELTSGIIENLISSFSCSEGKRLAGALFELSRMDCAVAACEAVLKQNASDPELCWLLFRCYDARDDAEHARLAINRLTAIRPLDEVELATFGLCLDRGGDPHGAIEALTQATSMSPDNPYIQYNLGVVYKDVGYRAQARAQWAEAREASSDEWINNLIDDALVRFPEE